MILKTGIDDNDRRLDRILRKALPDLPLSALHRLIRQGKILVNGSPAKINDRIASFSTIEIFNNKNSVFSLYSALMFRTRLRKNSDCFAVKLSAVIFVMEKRC